MRHHEQHHQAGEDGLGDEQRLKRVGEDARRKQALPAEERERFSERGGGDDEGKGHRRETGVEPQAHEQRQARKHHHEQDLGQHKQHRDEHRVGLRHASEVAR